MNAIPVNGNYLAFDTDLPSVAAMAAVEVDNLIKHKESTFQYLNELTNIIGQTFQSGVSQDTAAFRLIDPVSINVMSKSIKESRGAPLHSVDELTQAIHQLTLEMHRVQASDADTSNNEDYLSGLKQFCISLSRFALASRGKADPMVSAEFRR